MPKSYADLLREAREQIREVTAQEVDALDPGTTIVDVREASEWEQGYIPGASHVSKSYIEQQIEGIAPDRDQPVVLYCAGGVRSLFAAQTLAADGLHRRRLDERRLPGLEERRLRVRHARRPRAPSRSSATAATCSSPRSARRVRPSSSARRRCSSAPAASARRPRCTWPRRASAPSASSTSTSSTSRTCSARSSTRPTASASARSRARRIAINALNPDVKVVVHEEMLVAEQRRADHRRLRRDPRRDRHVRDPLHPQRRRGRGRHPGRPRQRLPVRGPAHDLRPVRGPVLPLPVPDPAAARARPRLLRRRRPRRRARHPRPAPDQRGAQGPARHRPHAGRPAGPVRCPRDRVHRAAAAARSALPGLLRRGRRGPRQAGRPLATDQRRRGRAVPPDHDRPGRHDLARRRAREHGLHPVRAPGQRRRRQVARRRRRLDPGRRRGRSSSATRRSRASC